MRLDSLRATLLAWLLPPLALLFAVHGWIDYHATVRQVRVAYDQALGDTALALADLIELDATPCDKPAALPSAAPAAQTAAQVNGQYPCSGTVRFRASSETARALRTVQTDQVHYAVLGPSRELMDGEEALTTIDAPVLPGRVKMLDATVQGRPSRVAVRGIGCGPGVCRVVVSETLDRRRHSERDVLSTTLGFIGLLAALVALIVPLAVGRALRPLRAASRQVAQRSLDDLRPVPTDGVPAEVKPVLQSLNRLLQRLQHAAGAQQAFIADAAHQLRTPLTSLRTDAELALLEAPQDARASLQRIHDGAERAARLATQLLAQARSEAVAHAGARECIDLMRVAEDAARQWVPHALARGVDLGFQLEQAPVVGHAALLQELLSNLIDNALAYAVPLPGAAAQITVRTRSGDGLAVLEVDDNGPGIPPGERARVLQRFQRGTAASGPGSGLGLSIAQGIARTHGGALHLLEGSGGLGLCVRVALPVA